MGVNVVWQEFESGPPITLSLAAELSDFGVIGDVPSVSALSNGKLMKIVGIPARGPDAYAMIANIDDASFKSSKDMKGKKIATVFGSTGHNFTMKLLDKNNLSFDDIDFISIKAGEAENALKSKLCDAVVILEPNVTRLTENSFSKIVAEGSETDLRGTNAFVVRSEYLEMHRDIVKVVIEQYCLAAEMIPFLDENTLTLVSNYMKIMPEQLKKIAGKYDFSVAVTDKDIASLQDTVEFLVKIGNLSIPYDVSKKIENLLEAK